jgi:hypothetical protein
LERCWLPPVPAGSSWAMCRSPVGRKTVAATPGRHTSGRPPTAAVSWAAQRQTADRRRRRWPREAVLGAGQGSSDAGTADISTPCYLYTLPIAFGFFSRPKIIKLKTGKVPAVIRGDSLLQDALKQKSHLCVPRKGIALPQSHFQH